MSELERLWSALVQSTDASSEAQRAEAWAAYAREHSVRYQLELLDLRTGRQLPVAELTAESQAFAVQLRVKDRVLTPDWRPKSAVNAQKLLME
jgi:hypothetical protein